MNNKITFPLKRLMLAAAWAIGLASPAQAAYVVIKADPTYGPAYPGLGWRATGALYVPDACLTASGSGSTTLTMATDSVCAGAQIENVKIHFYNVANPSTTIEILNVGTYVEDAGTMASENDLTQELISLSFEDGQLSGLRTSLSTPVLSYDMLAGNGTDLFSLNFSSVGARLVSFDNADATSDDIVSASQYKPTYTIGAWIADSDYVPLADEAVVPTRVVPEPGSVALVLAAIVMAAAGSRRRRG